MPQDNQNYLGTGMKFPPEINKATGRFVTSSGLQSVKESVYLILMTQLTERPLRPNFGTTLLSYTFLDQNLTTMNLMIRTLRGQIMSQEPRISDVEVTADTVSQEGAVIFNINYAVTAAHTRDSLVFPFYLNNDVEEEKYEPENYEPESMEEITY